MNFVVKLTSQLSVYCRLARPMISRTLYIVQTYLVFIATNPAFTLVAGNCHVVSSFEAAIIPLPTTLCAVRGPKA